MRISMPRIEKSKEDFIVKQQQSNIPPQQLYSENEILTVFSDGNMAITDTKNQIRSIWRDEDKNGKYDAIEETDYKNRKNSTIKLDEATNDITQIQKIYIDKFKAIGTADKKTQVAGFENRPLEIDGQIDISFQGETGDCWALSGINALAANKEGAKIIKNSISVDEKNNVTVNLAGTGETFTFTKQEINKNEGKLSMGDDDSRVLEMALEKHREKLLKSKKYSVFAEVLGYQDDKLCVGMGSLKDPLNGGHSTEAIGILTGKVTKKFFSANSAQDPSDYLKILFEEEENANKYLTLIQKNSEKYAATAVFKETKSENIVNAHAYSIKYIDKDYVTVVNPWNSLNTIKIKRQDFIDNCAEINYCDLTQK